MNDSAAARVPRSMGASRLRRRRRDAPPTPIELLLSDPATVYAAADAFAQAEQPEAAAWPFVASVGLRTVTLRWAFGPASSVPEPAPPWRPGRDTRVWIADREELSSGAPEAAAQDAGGTLVIGQFEETVVFINTSRAPGPITVTRGHDAEETELLRELIARQSRSLGAEWLDGSTAHGDTAEARRGAWWPIEIEDDAIVLLGLAIARMFTADEARLAVELMRRTATEERPRQTVVVGREVEAVDAEAPEDAEVQPETPATDVEYIEKWRRLGYVEEETEHTRQPGDAELEDWLRQVKAAAATATAIAVAVVHAPQPPQPKPQHTDVTDAAPIPAVSAAAAAPEAAAAPAFAPTFAPSPAPASASSPAPASAPAPAFTPASTHAPAPASAPSPAPASSSVPAPSSVPASASAPAPAPSPAAARAPVSSPAPTPVDDDLDDWASGFAVSSADQTARG